MIDSSEKSELLGDSFEYFASALAIGNIESARKHLEQDADLLDKQNKETGMTCFIVACCNGNGPAIEFLMSNLANPLLQDKDGNTALHWAARHGRLEICHKLVSYGARIHDHDKCDLTPLQVYGVLDSTRVYTNQDRLNIGTYLISAIPGHCMECGYECTCANGV